MIRHTALRRWMALAVLTLALGWPAAALAVAVSNPLTSVSFSNATSGYISGYSSVATMPSVLSYTHDGGLTWHASIIPNRLLTKVTASADGVSASAVGAPTDAIQSTANSGLTWTEQAPVLNRFVDLYGFAYLSGNRRVAIGRLHPSNQLALIASSVDGGPWNIDFEGPYHPSPDPDVDPPVTYAELAAIDSAPGGDVAWTVGQDRTDSQQLGPWPVLLYKTVNGGSTWTTQTISALTPEVTGISVADTQTAFISQMSRTLLRTRDGVTWQELPSAVPSVAWGVNPINALDTLDKDHLLIVGNNGRIGWSLNASADVPTFTVTTTQTVAGTALRGAQMLDATHWIVVGDNETILRTADGGRTWTGSKQMTAPTLKLTSPTRESMLSSTTISIEGTATDGLGIGVAGVEVKVQGGKAGWYWSGSAWQPVELWLPATTTDGWNTWSLKASLDSTISLENSMTITARARDGLSNVSSLASVRSLPGSTITITSVVSAKTPPVWRGAWTIRGRLVPETGPALNDQTVKLTGVSSTGASTSYDAQTDANGDFVFTVNPDQATTYSVRFAGNKAVNASTSASRKIFPPALIGTPVVPSYVTHTKYFKTYADLWPVHTPKTSALTLYFERYQLVGSVRKWVVLKTVSATALTTAINSSTRSRCSVSVKLPAGKSWRVRARHWDADHLKTYSPYKYFRVY